MSQPSGSKVILPSILRGWLLGDRWDDERHCVVLGEEGVVWGEIDFYEHVEDVK